MARSGSSSTSGFPRIGLVHKSLNRDNHLGPIAGVSRELSRLRNASDGLQRADQAGIGGREDSEWPLDPPKTEMIFDADLFTPNKTTERAMRDSRVVDSERYTISMLGSPGFEVDEDGEHFYS